ncbi:hypothetical protein CYMTET_32919 [Cymbomonas tetramitiformis]|uniref:Uncharacterized protein n=1 Tax=Cymbomonas tetramitiformis TaxID=36881 RepID=A0AAE0KRG5_9CHLO|nr:hypothetical protein CYMTET_32919 [Cymbomonas tetramitiformis]
MEDEDLYGDLYNESGEGDTLLTVKNTELKESLEKTQAVVTELTAKTTSLEEQVTILTEERTTLVRNISCLFKTAKEEISRKEDLISELQKKCVYQPEKPYFISFSYLS